MKDSIAFILQLPLKIYVFGHIYIFLPNRLYPELQKHYLTAKRDVAAGGKGHLTSKRNFPNWQQPLIMSKSNSPFWKNYFFMPISLTPFWNKYFFMSKSLIPVLKPPFYKLKSVCAAVLIFIIKTWNRVYRHLQIYYSASKSLSTALFIYTKTSIWNSPFLHRNFPLLMRFINNRKQHVSS